MSRGKKILSLLLTDATSNIIDENIEQENEKYVSNENFENQNKKGNIDENTRNALHKKDYICEQTKKNYKDIGDCFFTKNFENKHDATEKGAEKCYEFEDKTEEDPWSAYKKWQESKKKNQNLSENVICNLETSNNIENHTGIEYTPSVSENSKSSDSISLPSSTSWRPKKSDRCMATNELLGDNDSDSSIVWNTTSGSDSSENIQNEVRLNQHYETTSGDNRDIIPGSSGYGKPTQTSHTLIQDNGYTIELSCRKNRIWNKRDCCPFCNKHVTNFSRHLFRNHEENESVRKIQVLPKGSIERKKLIDYLRKQGNLSIYSEKVIRPVQRPSRCTNKTIISSNYLPCKYCNGLYNRRSLHRHAKNCFFNKEVDNSQIRYTSEGQTVLSFTESRRAFLNRLRLKNEVFTMMHADRISLNAKNDTIACQYAEEYLKKHKRPHIKNVVANKLRELGRLLIPLQDIYKINSLLEALKPENFEKVVAAGRIISGYDEATKSFKAPSLALHLRTTLLAVCSAAKTLILKQDPVLPVTHPEKTFKEIKQFNELVDKNWKFEMGSLALKDLNEKCFLFALTGTSHKWINGSSALRKYSKNCGAQCPDRLTSSRLRKHIATVLQILNLNEVEMEQIATFMGHTKKTHEQFYRLPQDMFQTSKVAKLLMNIEKGISKEEQGKTLDQLDIELGALEDDDKTQSKKIAFEEMDKNKKGKQQITEAVETSAVIKHVPINSGDMETEQPSTVCVQQESKYSNKHIRSKGSWNSKQKDIMLKHFKKWIKNKQAPKKKECLDFQQEHSPFFENKSWVQIKTFVYNSYRN